jgi:hypothetical protein
LQKANTEGIANDIVNVYRPVTRGEVALMLNRAANKAQTQQSQTAEGNEGNEEVDLGNLLGGLLNE